MSEQERNDDHEIVVNTVANPDEPITITVVLGPPRGPGEVGLNPPIAMMENLAWRRHVDRIRHRLH